MIVIETSLTPVQEIIVAQGLAEAIRHNNEVDGVCVVTNVRKFEATTVWESDDD